jgi:hypothetical protein
MIFLVREGMRSPLQHPASAQFADELAIPHLHPPAHGDDGRPAVNRIAFESVVVVVGVLSCY